MATILTMIVALSLGPVSSPSARVESAGTTTQAVDVKNHGAKCDGVADDGHALAAAQGAAGAARTILITCPLRITSAVGTLSAPLLFWGNGALNLRPGGSVTLSGSLHAPHSRIFSGYALPAPIDAAAVPSKAGGSLAAGTYAYRVSATNALGETLTSLETSITTTGRAAAVTLSWDRVPGATGYRIYGRRTGAQLLLMAAISDASTTTWTDTGVATPSGPLPTKNSTGGVLTFSAKVPQVVPQWWGAVGDGVTDDSVAAQAAIDAAPGNMVLFSAGTYRCNLKVLHSNTTISGQGRGTVLAAAVSTSPVVDVTAVRATGQLRGIRVSNLQLKGTGNAGYGLHLQAFTPYVIEGSVFDNLWFSSLGTALDITCSPANEVYQNFFSNLTSDTTSGDAYSVSGVYNSYVAIKATYCSRRMWFDKGSWHATVTSLDGDGPVRLEGAFGAYTGVTIETIHGPGPGPNAGAIQVANGFHTLRNVTITNVAHAKAGIGIEFSNTNPSYLYNYRVVASSNDDEHRPRYPMFMHERSSGSIENAVAADASLFTVEQATPASTLASWTLAGILSGVSSYAPVSPDRGDASVTLVPRLDSEIQLFATTLTAHRVVTLSTSGAIAGSRFRVVRTGMGAFTLDVGPGIKTIPSGTAAWVDVVFSGTAWVLTGYGTL